MQPPANQRASVHKKRCFPRSQISRVSRAISGYSSGSPPQIATIGVLHSFIAARHCPHAEHRAPLGFHSPLHVLVHPPIDQVTASRVFHCHHEVSATRGISRNPALSQGDTASFA